MRIRSRIQGLENISLKIRVTSVYPHRDVCLNFCFPFPIVFADIARYSREEIGGVKERSTSARFQTIKPSHVLFPECPGAKGAGPTSLALPVARAAAVGRGKRRDHPRGRRLPPWRNALPLARRVKAALD
jgi:hypothetical protein